MRERLQEHRGTILAATMIVLLCLAGVAHESTAVSSCHSARLSVMLAVEQLGRIQRSIDADKTIDDDGWQFVEVYLGNAQAKLAPMDFGHGALMENQATSRWNAAKNGSLEKGDELQPALEGLQQAQDDLAIAASAGYFSTLLGHIVNPDSCALCEAARMLQEPTA